MTKLLIKLFANNKQFSLCLFVTNKQSVEAIQVCYTLTPTNIEREVKGHEEVMQKYDIKNGKIITYSMELTTLFSKNTIEVVEAWQWLLNK